jgi:hypothetical protein
MTAKVTSTGVSVRTITTYRVDHTVKAPRYVMDDRVNEYVEQVLREEPLPAELAGLDFSKAHYSIEVGWIVNGAARAVVRFEFEDGERDEGLL